jgi:hypothetical protein
MPKYAQVMDDATNMPNLDLIRNILDKTMSSEPSGQYFKTALPEKEKEASLDDLEEMDITKLSDKQFNLIKKVLHEDEDVSVVSTEDDSDTAIVSMEEPEMGLDEEPMEEPEMGLDEEPMDDEVSVESELGADATAEEEINQFLNISADAGADIGLSMEDDVLTIDTGDVDIDVNLDQLIDDYADTGDVEELPTDEPIPENEDGIEVANAELDSVDETELTVQEQAQLRKIKRNVETVLLQVKGFKEACKTKGKVKSKKTVKNLKVKSAKKKGSKEEALVKEAVELQKRLEALLSESAPVKKEKKLFEDFDKLTDKFDRMLESMLREDDEEIADEDFSINDDITSVDDALDKSEDILSGDIETDEDPSVVHITLPAGVSADDISVKVIEESEGSPVIQIELPEGANVEEIDATVGEPVAVDGVDDVAPVEDVPVEEMPEDVPAEDTEIPADEIEDVELDKEDEDKLEEAINVLNKKLLPVAENAKYSAYKASKNVMESAQKPDTSYNTNILKQTHLYYMNEGKSIMDYRYPIADVIDGNVYAMPEAIDKMVEMFSNPSMVKKIGAPIVKVVRARLMPYLEAMGKKAPWKNKDSNLIITEKGMLLTVCHKREAHDPSAILKRIREDFDGSK